MPDAELRGQLKALMEAAFAFKERDSTFNHLWLTTEIEKANALLNATPSANASSEN